MSLLQVALGLAISAVVLLSSSAQGSEGAPLHNTADRQVWHRRENIVELFGHAVVSQPGETLRADYVTLDLNSRVLDAKGNCVYTSAGSTIYGDEMHFNLDTRTGTVVGGRVSNDRFTLTGQRINKLGDGRFQTHWGEYSTCVDCPNSWSLLAEDVDMQIEGYAFMSNVTSKVADAPAVWLPYLVVPMKQRRQSGFLFPSFAFNSLDGMRLVLPFFWAVNRSLDFTVGTGIYTARGARLELEGRYALSDRSFGKANFFFLRDSTFVDTNRTPLPNNRFALDVSQVQELPFGLIEKLRITEMSDNLYPTKVGDIPGSGELNAPSSISLSYANSQISAWIAARRYRTLINTTPDPTLAITQFDPRTVQAIPVAQVSANDRILPSFDSLPIAAGLSLGISNFTRSLDAFDYDNATVPFGSTIPDIPPPYTPGQDPIRKATRLSVTPSLYTSVRPFDLFSVTPSLRYYYYWYTFPLSDHSDVNNFRANNLNRAYLQFQTDLVAQFERVFEYPEDKDTPRVKHLIRPLLTYSFIPDEPFTREDEGHPFLQQIRYATRNGFSGYNFDDNDIVPRDSSPLTSNYFVPLGNSLTFGATTQWIKRHGSVDSLSPTYVRYIDSSVGSSINFREFDKGGGQPLTRVFNSLELQLGRFTYQHLYYWYPYFHGNKNTLTSTLNYVLDRSVHEGLFTFDRSLGLTYALDQRQGVNNTHALTMSLAYSLSDYFLPTGYISYQFVDHKFLGGGMQLQFQSPSRCWKFTFSSAFDINRIKPNSEGKSNIFDGFNFNVDLALNIAGTGFGGITEVANTATASK